MGNRKYGIRYDSMNPDYQFLLQINYNISNEIHFIGCKEDYIDLFVMVVVLWKIKKKK